MVKYRGLASWQVTGIRHARPRNHFIISRGYTETRDACASVRKSRALGGQLKNNDVDGGGLKREEGSQTSLIRSNLRKRREEKKKERRKRRESAYTSSIVIKRRRKRFLCKKKKKKIINRNWTIKEKRDTPAIVLKVYRVRVTLNAAACPTIVTKKKRTLVYRYNTPPIFDPI